MGSTPVRYQRSSVPTANECRRQCRWGGETPAGMLRFSFATRSWNLALTVVGCTGRRLFGSKENSGHSAGRASRRASVRCG